MKWVGSSHSASSIALGTSEALDDRLPSEKNAQGSEGGAARGRHDLKGTPLRRGRWRQGAVAELPSMDGFRGRLVEAPTDWADGDVARRCFHRVMTLSIRAKREVPRGLHRVMTLSARTTRDVHGVMTLSTREEPDVRQRVDEFLTLFTPIGWTISTASPQ